MKMLFQAASAAAFCSLALSGITHAQSAEYIDKRLKQIDDNIAKFERKIAYREAKVERIRETLASLMAEPPTSE